MKKFKELSKKKVSLVEKDILEKLKKYKLVIDN